MSVILSPEIEQALADLRQAMIKQLEAQQTSQAKIPVAPLVTNNNSGVSAVLPTEVSSAVVLPSVINQTSTVYQSSSNAHGLGDDPTASLPYPEIPTINNPIPQAESSLPINQTSTDMPVPQMPMPDLSSANSAPFQPVNQSPTISPPVFNSSPAEMNVNDNQQVEFVPNPNQVITHESSKPPEIAPNPQPASFAKARGLLSSVLQKHHS